MDIDAADFGRERGRFGALLLVGFALFAFVFCLWQQRQTDRMLDALTRPAPTAVLAPDDAPPPADDDAGAGSVNGVTLAAPSVRAD
jgi:hypothetical protein